MKHITSVILILLIGFKGLSQTKDTYTFGKISQQDFDLNVYERDSTANAVYLYEKGETTFKETHTSIIISTKYYAKIKIFNKEAFDIATVEIPIYNNKNSSEKVKNIRAITHNGIQKTYLSKDNIYTDKINDNWSEVKFTMPNLKENSIIEYEYTLESPFKFNFTGWEFQAEIPKVESMFYALIPGNYIYNRRLDGFQKLSQNESKVKKRCFSISGIRGEADCEELFYAMENIPAFIEEDYMTAKKNYLSAIKFELSEYRGFDGVNTKFTKTWKDVDREFKTDKNIGRQLRKVDYLEKQLPEDLLTGINDLKKAKKIYAFIKNHFTWNGKTRLFREVDVKEAFSNKIGNSTEINIALINALSAVGFDAEIVMLSTRDNGLPTKLYPVMTDFNYAIAKLNINDKSYLLDATDRLMPFGKLPFNTLNTYGRVMNFKKGSYWTDIIPDKNNRVLMSMDLEIDENGNFHGIIKNLYSGYRALNKRREIKEVAEENYLDKIENDDNIIVNSYKNSNLEETDKNLKEEFDITIESNMNEKLLLINPFILSKTGKNPFQLKERSYPVDFGYARSFTYTLTLKVPDNYKVKSLPENVAFKLPNEGGRYIFGIEQKGDEIKMIYKFSVDRYYFVPEEYPYLKEFYAQIIKTQNSLITLEKNK
ncbi:hypothetical protein UMM65_03150 [Aureibaculum sp. 2210JD6-5]|uniref:transglutaminase domain-containing protein n=1 Tax=Aureibaculum sp. 2210JD6-5 TaxID=3103957 RepID=UPI002AAC65BC|nr:hypothetical protein [Aureibaculum sp. 2210JD6-5]MDY7394224.1 hypothetical protein [Aureibaculum sp. 2210JD6-5]